MSVSACFYVSKIEKTPHDFVGVTLQAVTRSVGKEGYESLNKDWAKYTPSGQITMNVSTETGAAAWFEEHLGKDVAITFADGV